MAWRFLLRRNPPSDIRFYFATDSAEVMNTFDNIRLLQFGKAATTFFFNPKIVQDG